MNLRFAEQFKQPNGVRCISPEGKERKNHEWIHHDWRKVIEGENAGFWQEVLRCKHNCGKHKGGKFQWSR